MRIAPLLRDTTHFYIDVFGRSLMIISWVANTSVFLRHLDYFVLFHSRGSLRPWPYSATGYAMEGDGMAA